MPTYDFQCKQCLNEFEKNVPTTAKSPRPACPYCKSRNTRKLIKPMPIIYKADGYTKKVAK